MAEGKAKLRYTWISPRKLRLVADEIRGKSVDEALGFLMSMRNRKKAITPMEKTVKSAVANLSDKQPDIDTEKMFIKTVFVDAGPAHQRIRARAQGRALPRQKRTSHLTVVVAD